jgi:large subunit ribosomal protein L23
MFKIIKFPILTEKTVRILEIYNQYVFSVDSQLTKPQIRLLLEKIFSVHILKIRTHRPPCKRRYRGLVN